MKMMLLSAFLWLTTCSFSAFWGFFAHERINKLAVFTLPPDMIGFYKSNISNITQMSVNPDKRRYVLEEEAARHYLDADHYGDSALLRFPKHWNEAVVRYSEDTLIAYGILPWHIHRVYVQLRDAFMVGDPSEIVGISAELGHYVADAHVPLHTTENYNGQLTGQEGIHGFWESRLPEVFFNEYDFFVGKADYLRDPQAEAWHVVRSSHSLVAELLSKERELAARYQEKKYGFETRGNTTVKVYALEFAEAYHRKLDGMVEKQMRRSVKATGDFWYTAWINAGQPDLTKLLHHKPSEEELRNSREEVSQFKRTLGKMRAHE